MTHFLMTARTFNSSDAETRERALAALDHLRGSDETYARAIDEFVAQTGVPKSRLYYWLRLRETVKGSTEPRSKKTGVSRRKALTKKEMLSVIEMGSRVFQVRNKKTSFKEIGQQFGISQSHAYEIYLMRRTILAEIQRDEGKTTATHGVNEFRNSRDSSPNLSSQSATPVESRPSSASTEPMLHATSDLDETAGSSIFETFAQLQASKAFTQNQLSFLSQWNYKLRLPTICAD